MIKLLEKETAQQQADGFEGLSRQEAAARLARDGENVLEHKKKNSALKIFAGQFHDVMVIILMIATLVSVILGQYTDAIPILLIVILNAFLGFFQEWRCEKTLEKLKDMTAPAAMCYRDSKLVKIPASEVVTGDIISLTAGDRVPCDGFVLSAKGLECNESLLTGESEGVVKKRRTVENDFSSPGCGYMCYMGTVVTKGNGVINCTATGKNTQMGKISSMLEEIQDPPTPLQKKLGELGKVLAVICLGVCVLVFAAGVLRGEPILEMVMTGITIAIAAIPEGLPATVTIALALGVRRMLRQKALVHKLRSVETLGCATVICTDKTGTLTQNRMRVTHIVTAQEGINQFDLSGTADIPRSTALQKLLECACVCSDAKLNVSGGRHPVYNAQGDPTEAALVTAAAQLGVFAASLDIEKTDEIPFDSQSRSMTVICKDSQGTFSYKKGACDVILSECMFTYPDDTVRELDNGQRLSIAKLCDSYCAKGLRVIAFEQTRQDKHIFLGFAALEDPPRKEARSAVELCAKAGIKTVMITGDHKLTAKAVGEQTGIYKKGSLILTGADLDRIGDEELEKVAENCSIFARVNPVHKLRIVKAFKKHGHVCAMTGDGVNDAPAIKEADIGVSMGRSGTEVTKQAADMILLDDNFATLVNAVEEGRTIYHNIRKFVRYLISCNIGEVLTMLGGMVMGLPMVLLPVQILLVNLVTDSLPAVALGLEPPEESFMHSAPRRSDESFFSGGLLWRMIIRGVFIALSTLASFTLVLKYSGSIQAARTAALCTLTVSQLIHVFECKSERKTLFSIDLFSNPFLVFSVAVSALLVFVCIYLPVMHKVFFTFPLTRTQLVIALSCAGVVPVLASIFHKK